MRRIDLLGKRFHRLVVIERVEIELPSIKGPKRRHRRFRTRWRCKCDCGNYTTVDGGSLRDRNTTSCGCWGRTNIVERGKQDRHSVCCSCGIRFQHTHWRKFCNNCVGPARTVTRQRGDLQQRLSLRGRLSRLLITARCNARRKGYSFDNNILSADFLLKLALQQGSRCAQTGIPFVISRESSPWMPSIDRIDSSKGYKQDNIQLVCWMYNVGKNRWSHQELLYQCRQILKNSKLKAVNRTKS